MANSPQAIKRARQSVKRTEHNQSRRAGMRTAVKKVLKALAAGEVKQAAELFKQACSAVDRVAGRGLITKNRAARYKKRLHARLKAANS